MTKKKSEFDKVVKRVTSDPDDNRRLWRPYPCSECGAPPGQSCFVGGDRAKEAPKPHKVRIDNGVSRMLGLSNYNRL